MRKIVDSKNLYRGIFWIVDMEDLHKNDKYFFMIECDSLGNKLTNTIFNSKNGNSYNHKLTWDNMDGNRRNNKPYNYFPRGRVEISNGKALIYLNPNIATDKIKNFIISKYNLYGVNGINQIRMIPDYSEHYKCYLDRTIS